MMLAVNESLEKAEFLERLSRAIDRSGLDDIQVAEQLGISKQAFSQIRSGERPGHVHREAIARILQIDQQWLNFGDHDRAPTWWSYYAPRTAPLRVGENVENSGGGGSEVGHGIHVVGTVIAGDGQLSDRSALEHADGIPLMIPDSWQALQVKGNSAYPVVYPDQIVLIDTDRAARPDSSDWGEKQLIDLHDNIVLIETDEPPDLGKATSGRRAYLKRFCMDKRAPDGFVLASIDSGRSSPYVPADRIMMIVPVVGVLYQDPRRPREKRWHAKTVVVTVHP